VEQRKDRTAWQLQHLATAKAALLSLDTANCRQAGLFGEEAIDLEAYYVRRCCESREGELEDGSPHVALVGLLAKDANCPMADVDLRHRC